VKELRNRNTEFHTYKPKQERSFKMILKHIHVTTNLDDMKKEIEDLEYRITNIWNIKKQGTKMALHICVEVQPKSNNKHIYDVGSLLHYKVKVKLNLQIHKTDMSKQEDHASVARIEKKQLNTNQNRQET